MLEGNALDAAGEVDGPGNVVRSIAANPLDRGLFAVGEVLVPAKALQHTVGELRIAVLDLGILGIGTLGEKVDLLLRTIRLRLLILHTEPGAEGAAAILHMKVGVVELMGARMTIFRRAPAGPRQAVVIASDLGRRILRRPQRHQVKLFLMLHVGLQALRRLAAIAS